MPKMGAMGGMSMGTRFRKSVNLGGGARLTASKSGLTVSGGVKGARTSVSTSGRKRTTVSVPGTGISYTKEHGNHGGKRVEGSSSDSYYFKDRVTPKTDEQDTFSVTLDKKTLQSLNNEAFKTYANGYIEYAKTSPENSEEVLNQISMIREEAERRKSSANKSKSGSRTQQGKKKGGLLRPIIVIFSLIAIWGAIFGNGGKKEEEPTLEQRTVVEPLPDIQPTDGKADKDTEQQEESEDVREMQPAAQEQQAAQPRSVASITYVGSAESDKFHKPSCRFAKEILPGNLIEFSSREDAVNRGYVPCGTCHP